MKWQLGLEKNLKNNYDARLKLLRLTIDKNFPNTSYEISKLDNDFGPAAITGNVEALVVSEETSHKGILLNNLRAEKNLALVQIVIVPMIFAKDGKRISTTRIRNSEIDSEGNCLSGDLKLLATLSTNSTTGLGPHGFI